MSTIVPIPKKACEDKHSVKDYLGINSNNNNIYLKSSIQTSSIDQSRLL